MLKLFQYLSKKDWLFAALCVALLVFHVWLDLKIPDYMSEITLLIQTPGSEMSNVLEQGGMMLLCAFGSLISSVIVGYFAATISSNFSMTLREQVFTKVGQFSTAEVKKFQTSSLITRTTNDVTQMETLIATGLQTIIKAPIMAAWAISKILGKSLELSALTGACVVALLVVIIIIISIVLPRFQKVQKLIDRINGVTRENLTGVRVARAFNAESYQESRFAAVNSELTATQLFNQRTFAALFPSINFVMHFLSLGIYFLGAILIANANALDRLTLFSNVVVFSSYGMQVIMSFLMLALIFMILPRAQISARRINEVLDEQISILDGEFSDDTAEHGVVEFKHVSFKYPDADDCLLQDISFIARPGETVAFIGSTGSGKSTLINLIPRFYDATDGKILVDGIDVKDYTLTALRNKLGYVSQKAFMFDASVQDNVAYGDNGRERASAATIQQAIDVAQGTDFVSALDGGLQARIARGGTNISGGQKQRLSIARAIARNPEIYIFDDTFSALDFKTDASLRKALKKHTKHATSLIVAQRIGTIIDADQIIVLDKGKCVGKGTHKELLKTCPVYKEIALSQLGEEELKNA